MAQVALQIPILGLSDSTEEAKVVSDFTALRDAINSLDLSNFSTALQALLPPATWQAYSPAWTASLGAPVLNNGTLNGYFLRFGKTCMFQIWLVPGTTTNSGLGNIQFSLPVQATASSVLLEQTVPCKLYSAHDTNVYEGIGTIGASANTVQPWFPNVTAPNPLSIPSAQFRNADGTGSTGTGVPYIAASSPLIPGSNFFVGGTYQTI